jgi:hypothetical protein
MYTRCFLSFLLFLIILLQLQNPLQSQTKLKGKVWDENQIPLSHINILVYPHGNQNLIAFGISRIDGTFEINLRTTADSLRLEATSIHYRTDSLIIANVSQELLFHLAPETRDLSEFVVRANPIEKQGDTISYLVSSFAREQDRVISDVLKQMPGIEVEPSGRILYQGDPIQNFYVEGLDLMGGRYGLVSSNMPHKSVSTVQIMENHQPIKILEERLPSHRASLNITLKREVTTTGAARLGSGLTPLLWDANATPMMFTRKFQLAGSYQANNTGNEVTRQLDALTLEDLRERMENNLTRPSLLGIHLLSPPGFNENRYLDNNVHLLNANALVKLPGELQLRTNLHYIYDFRRQYGKTHRTLYTPTDTLEFDEQIHNKLQDNALRGEITITRNSKINYLNNILEFQSYHNKRNSNITSDSTTSVQYLRNPFRTLSNRLNMVTPIGEKLVQLNSHLYYDYSPHQLNIAPGRFEGVFNMGEPYEKIIQKSNIQRFIATHSAGLTLGWRRWSITPRLGFQYQQQQHSSNIIAETDHSNTEPGEDFKNSLDGLRTRTYLQTEFLYKRNNRFFLNVDIPISHVYIKLQDEPLDRKQNISRILLEPRISADYRMGGFWRTRVSWSYKSHMGGIEGIHFAWILSNHRNMQINDVPLKESKTHSLSAFLSYRNPIKGLFTSLSYMYFIRNNNLLYTNTVNTDGTTLIRAIELPNTSSTHNVNARASKYFSSIKSTLSMQGSLGLNIQDQWVNDKIFPGRNHTFSLTPKVNIRLAEWMNTEWSAGWLYYDTYHDREKLNEVNLLKYFGNLLFFPTSNQHLAINGEYYQHETRSNYFVDLQYRYTITARKIDVDVRWVNVFNHKNYVDYQVGPFLLQENEYTLRPTQLLLAVRFSF